MRALKLELKESRHPVIESNLPAGEQYIANDICIESVTDSKSLFLPARI